MYITFASTKVNKAEPTLGLKPRGDVTRNPKQGYQWHQNRTRVCVCQKHLNKLTHFLKTCNFGVVPSLTVKRSNINIFKIFFFATIVNCSPLKYK